MPESLDYPNIFVPQPDKPEPVAQAPYSAEALPGSMVDNEDPLHTTYDPGIERDIRRGPTDTTTRGLATTAVNAAVGDSEHTGAADDSLQAPLLETSDSKTLVEPARGEEQTELVVADKPVAEGPGEQRFFITEEAEERVITPREVALDKLRAYHEKNDITRPDGPRNALGLVENLVQAGCIDEALDLAEFMAKPPHANSAETDHSRFVLQYGWESDWTHSVIEAASSAKYAGQHDVADKLTDRLLKAVGGYGVSIFAGDEGFLSTNCMSSATRTVQRIYREYSDALDGVAEGASTRIIEWNKENQIRQAERTYAQVIGKVLRGFYSGYGPDMVRQLLNIERYPDAAEIMGKTVERLLEPGNFSYMVQHLKLDGTVLENAWTTGYGDSDANGRKYKGAISPEQYRTENIETIGNLERVRPGAATLLHAKLHLSNFARLEGNILSDAVKLCAGEIDFSKRNGPVVLLVQNGYDHNGSSYGKRAMHRNLAYNLAVHNGIVVPIEIRDSSSPDEVSQNLRDLGLPEADLLLWDSHGRDNTLVSATAAAANGNNTPEETRRLGEAFKPLMRSDGEAMMYTCEGGKNQKTGPARIFANALGLLTWSSPEVTSVASLKVTVRGGRIEGSQILFRHKDLGNVSPVLIRPGR